ncbi:unnamed protein product [Paramecium sonneborni]|uniref:Uncharacterized protein n=1 Tax=Paramecium sonneborni TaxID=65129 RepID=A0A8S1QH69_9CILI|nr:unnamed protein product [Paramecium sonneborni]
MMIMKSEQENGLIQLRYLKMARKLLFMLVFIKMTKKKVLGIL